MKSNYDNFLKDGSSDLTLVDYITSNREFKGKDFYFEPFPLQWIFN
jgi:hypothetical protein